MASDLVVHLEDSNFEEETKSGYALIDFWAAWCGPCVSLAPLIDEIAGDMEGKLKVCKLDVDKIWSQQHVLEYAESLTSFCSKMEKK